MCGISGILSLNNSPIDFVSLVQMTDKLANRGPDGEGYLISNNNEFFSSLKTKNEELYGSFIDHHQHIGLGHRRLATTDLNFNASQPMTDAKKRYWIVFNGQIYNHLQLRKELEGYGYKFITDHSDTEVILNAYAHWGNDCLLKLKGMWAFCLWDSVENRVFISRDRVGKQPLFYTIHNNQFYFASELNALLNVSGIKKELDEFSVYDYLTYANVPAPKTIYKNIYKLQASHFLSFKPGEDFVSKRYWSPISTQPAVQMNEKEIISEIRNQIYEAVRSRMTSDVEVGMLLSGGLDSSVNLACMAKFSQTGVKTYTVGFENKNQYKNEFTYAKKVASFFKADYNELVISEKDFLDFLPGVTYLQDEPIADTANIPLYFVSKMAHQDKIKILLSGEGSDEIFIGYEHWRLIYEYEKIFRNRPIMAKTFGYLHGKSIFKNKRPHYKAWSYKTKNNWPVFWSGTELRTEEEKHKILSQSYLDKIKNYNSFTPKRELYDQFIATKPYDTFEWMSINDLQNRLPDQLLARLDRMTMASSIEGRNPFLDIGIIEFMLRVPAHLKVKGRTEKYLLKKAFEGILPHEIIYRSKDSFTVPLNEIFKNEERKREYIDMINQFNADTCIFSDQFIKQLALPKNIKDFWNILNFAFWYQSHK